MQGMVESGIPLVLASAEAFHTGVERGFVAQL